MTYVRSLVVLSAIASSLPASADAQKPGASVEVHVRAESRIDLEWVDQGAPKLEGRVQDDLGRALGSREIRVEFVDGFDRRVEKRPIADEQGYFWIDRPIGMEPPIHVRARFEGDDNYEASYVTLKSDKTERKPMLKVRIVDPVDLGLEHVELALALSVDDEPVRATVSVQNELGHRLASQIVDGASVLELEPESLGPPGDGRLVVESEGTPEFGSRRTETPIRRRIRPSLTIEASSENGTTKLCGELKDRYGALPDRIVELHRESERIATLRTDSQGRFCRAVTPSDEAASEFVASFAGDGRGRWPTKSQSVKLRPALEKQRSATWIGPLLTMILGSLVWFLLSRRVSSEQDSQANEKPHEAGVRTATPRRTRADAHGFCVKVFALDSGQPLAASRVMLKSESGAELQLHTDAKGCAQVERLERGSWRLEVDHEPGYVAESSSLSVPHRGQWSNAEVFLRSVRQHADILWTELASELSGKDVQQLTQREIAQVLPELSKAKELAHNVEVTTYGSTPKGTDHLQKLRERAEVVRSEASTARQSPHIPEK